MEQQESVSSVMGAEAIQKAPDPAPELNWNEENVEVEFRDGMYYCKDLDGGYLTRDSLKKAWRMQIWAKKMAEAQELRERSIHSGKISSEERGKMRTAADGLEKKWRNPLEEPTKERYKNVGRKKKEETKDE